MKNLIKIFLAVLIAHNIAFADNCPDFNSLYINQAWENIDGWENIPSYLKGDFSGLNKIAVTQQKDGYLTACFYTALNDNNNYSNRVYRKIYNAKHFSGNSVVWTQTSSNHYSCQPANAENYADCSYHFS